MTCFKCFLFVMKHHKRENYLFYSESTFVCRTFNKYQLIKLLSHISQSIKSINDESRHQSMIINRLYHLVLIQILNLKMTLFEICFYLYRQSLIVDFH